MRSTIVLVYYAIGAPLLRLKEACYLTSIARGTDGLCDAVLDLRKLPGRRGGGLGIDA